MQQYRVLYTLIEGPDDERFVNNVVIKLLKEKYSWIQPYQYAKKSPIQICRFIRSIKGMNADYIFFADIDLAPCVTSKKERILEKYSELENDKIVIVRAEIESWYLAGLDGLKQGQLRISTFNNTDRVTKEKFDEIKHPRFASKIDFMIEILKHYSIDIAQNQNTSFRYFLSKHCKYQESKH